MPAQYTIRLTTDQLTEISKGDGTPTAGYTLVGIDKDGNQLPEIAIDIIGPVVDSTAIATAEPVETEVEDQIEDNDGLEMDAEEEIGNVAPEEEAAITAMGFDPMTESKISSFSTFLKRK